MDGRVLARIAAIVIVAVTITAAAIQLARQDAPVDARPPSPTAEAPEADPLSERLERCRQLGEAATRDADCLATWEENRHRFLTPAEGR